MTKVYGGLWLENLWAQDKYFDLQLKLFEKKLTQGLQLRVAHPCFTPGLTSELLSEVLDRFPEDLKIFIHFAGETAGVDFGENFDECGVFLERGSGRKWVRWNEQSIKWGLLVADAAGARIGKNHVGTLHLGYGKWLTDEFSRERAVEQIKKLPSTVALENVRLIPDKRFYKNPPMTKYWSQDKYWGFGGTPSDMSRLLGETGPYRRCLLDFTHMFVTSNQARKFGLLELGEWRKFDDVIFAFLRLPHFPVCHFSGAPPTLEDDHNHILDEPVGSIKEALQEMEVVCLEIPFLSKTAEKTVEEFREMYGIF